MKYVMNKKLVFINVIVFILLLITSICTIMFFFSNDSDSTRNWFEKSERGYTITGKEIGKASWGGTSRARIEIYDSEKSKSLVYRAHLKPLKVISSKHFANQR